MKTAAAAIAIAALAAAPAIAGNILLNPGFETGFLAPWYQGNDFGGPENWNVTSKEAHTGQFSATDVGNKQIRQDFAPVFVGDILEASLWIKNPDDGGPRVNAIDFYYSDGSSSENVVFQPNN